MATITLPLSPQFPTFTTGKPNGLNVNVAGNVANRLIPQDGARMGKDAFNMDTLSVPFKIFAGADWKKLLPARGDSISGFSNMVVWDPMLTCTVGKVWVEMEILLKGLMALNGVNNQYNGFRLNPPPKDATGVASAQISGTDGSSVMDVTFYRPQTVYRYVTTSDEVEPPEVVNDAAKRIPRIISYSVRGSTAEPTPSVGGGVGDQVGQTVPFIGYNIDVRQRCDDVVTEKVGNYFQNEATVVYEYYDTSTSS